jgi:hypothetical protein
LPRIREFRLTVAYSTAAFVAELQVHEVLPAFISPPKRPQPKSGEMLFSKIIRCVDLLLFLPCCVLVSSRLTDLNMIIRFSHRSLWCHRCSLANQWPCSQHWQWQGARLLATNHGL